MNTEQKQIDTHTYPENASPLELARFQVAVMEAVESGAPREWSQPKFMGAWILLSEKDANWDWFHARYRVARPKIAEGHNPAQLTVDQVGVKDGWRLLTDAEHESTGYVAETQWWNSREWSPGRDETGSWNTKEGPIRTENPPGHYLPKPAPVKTLRPWTFEIAPKGCVLVRGKGESSKPYASLVVEWDTEGVHGGNARSWTWFTLHEYCEHSTDNGATWLPCGTFAEGDK